MDKVSSLHTHSRFSRNPCHPCLPSAFVLGMSFSAPFPSHFHFHGFFLCSHFHGSVQHKKQNRTDQIMLISGVTVSSDVSIFSPLDFVWFMVQWFPNFFFKIYACITEMKQTLPKRTEKMVLREPNLNVFCFLVWVTIENDSV